MLLVICSAATPLSAGAEPHQVPRIAGPIAVDGVLDDAGWRDALVLELGYEVQPAENTPALVRTQVLVCFDERHLYAAFRAFDPDPTAIRARYSDRDRILDDDWVALVLDTFDDARRSFDFFVNPLGIQADSIEATGGSSVLEWDAIWDSAGRIGPDGYVVEIAIPFSSLRFQPTAGDQTWRVDAVRSYPRTVDHRLALFPRDRSNNCYLCQADQVKGFAGATPGHAIELDPTLTALRSEARKPFPDGRFAAGESNVELGLTARWGVTPNLNLSAVVNPDFSQVEADAAQLDVNTQFSLFYPEKRPFFLEGVDYFSTPINAVYTRTMAEPAWGLKTAGKIGAGALGVFAVKDDVTNLLLPGPEGSDSRSLDRASTSSVLRYRRDIGGSSTVGGMITSREADGYHNRLYAADFNLRITPRDSLVGQIALTDTRYPGELADLADQPRGSFRGNATDVLFSHRTRTLEYYGHYVRISPGFRADLGFMPRAGYRFYDSGVLFTWQQNDPHHWYNLFRVWFGYEYEEDWNGAMLRTAPGTFILYNGPLQSSLFAIVYGGRRTYRGVEYDNRSIDAQFEIQPLGDLKFGLRLQAGDAIDYEFNRAGDRLRLTPSLQLYAGRHLNLELAHIHERFDIDAGRLYTADLSELRTIYQFNRRAFVRLILQYDDHSYEEEHYPQPIDPEYRRLLTQLLFSYKINPWTALYLGYSDRSQGDSQVSLTRSDRTAFLKIGYAWVP